MEALSLPLASAIGAIVAVALAWVAFLIGERRAREQAEELNRLNEIGAQLLRAQLNVDDLCERVYSLSRAIIPTALFQLGLFDGDRYEVKVWVKDGQRHPQEVFPEGGHSGIVGWVRKTGHPLLVRDFEEERATLPAFPQWGATDPARSGVFIPLIAGTATIGVMMVQSRTANAFTQEQVRLLTALGNLAASAIRNAQLFENIRYRAEQLNLIGQITARISAIQPLPDLFRQIVTLTQQTFGYYAVSIYLVDAKREFVEIGASTSDDLAEQLARIEMGTGLIGWVGQEGRPALANDVATDTRYRYVDFLPGTASEVALPLIVEGEVLGVLDVQSDEVGAFSGDDIALLETLASQTAIAVDQAQSYAAKVRVGRRLQALTEVTQVVVSVLDLDDLFERVVDLVSETFDFERVHIFIKIEDSIAFRAGAGPHSVRWMMEELAYDLDEPGLIPAVARSGEPVLVDDVTLARDYRAGPSLEDTRSEMVVPVQIGERVLGVIDVQSTQVAAFTEDDLRLMLSLADSVAVAMRNAALYISERQRRLLAHRLREVSAYVAADLDLDEVLTSIIDGLGEVLTLRTAAILLVEGDSLHVAAFSAPNPTPSIVGERLPLDQRDEQAQTVAHRYQRLLGPERPYTCASVPLTVADDLIGYLVAEPSGDDLDANEDAILATFAHQAAIAIDNARLYDSQRAEAYVSTALLRVAEAVNTQINVTEALTTIARLTVLLAGVRHCLIYRWDAETKAFTLTAFNGVDYDRARFAQGQPLPASQHPYLDLMSVTHRRLGAGQGHLLPIPEGITALVESPAVMGFPLTTLGDTVGLMIVDAPEEPADPRRIKILTGIAHQAATALETAALQRDAAERDRLERELSVARTIQASFIPESPPALPGWSFWATWRAARQVGGDFYDFIPLPDGRWGLVMADVADKGIPAALFMAMCRTLLRAVAVETASPAETLRRLNTLLLSENRSDLFVTVFYAIWDPVSGALSYASGGHTPSLLLRSEGQVDRLKPKGIALGIIAEVTLDEETTTLNVGDALVAYTDGVTEAMQANHAEWGLGRFKQALNAGSDGSAQTIVQGVLSEIEAFVGGAPQSDDLTLWVLKRHSTDD